MAKKFTKKEREQYGKEQKELFRKNILKYQDQIQCPNSDDLEFQTINIANVVYDSGYELKNVPNSWFKIEASYFDEQIANNFKHKKTPRINEYYSTKKITMILNDDQKKILNGWFKAYALMYNKTIDYIGKNFKQTEKVSFITTRNNLKKKIKKIIKKSHCDFYNDDIKDYKKKNAKLTIRDKIICNSVKNACSAYNGNVTRIKNGHIDHFNMKKLKHHRSARVMECDHQLIKDGNFCKPALGNIKYEYDNLPFDIMNVNSGFIIQHDKISKKYYMFGSIYTEITKNTYSNKNIDIKTLKKEYDKINTKRYWHQNENLEKNQLSKKLKNRKKDLTFVSVADTIQFEKDTKKYRKERKELKLKEKELRKQVVIYQDNIKIKERKEENNYISLDPGLRTFMTGISNTEVLKIGDECKPKLEKYINNITRIRYIYETSKRNKKENKKSCYSISKKKMKKIERRNNRKLKNLVDDMQWKSIKYLVTNYENIYIGNMSSKNIVSNTKNVNKIDKMNKNIAMRLNFYNFRERLRYKSEIYQCNYHVVKETYTSQMCSCCGNCKMNLGARKIYDCTNCNVSMTRDVNGARGILIKGLADM